MRRHDPILLYLLAHNLCIVIAFPIDGMTHICVTYPTHPVTSVQLTPVSANAPKNLIYRQSFDKLHGTMVTGGI